MASPAVSLTALLESPVLLLRSYTISDAGTLAHALVANRERLMEVCFDRLEEANDLAKVEAFIERKRQQWVQGQEFRFAVWDKARLTFVGEIALQDIVWSVPKAEIGYFVLRECEGKGYITQALMQIVEFAFQRLNMKRLQIRSNVDNLRSRRVAERSGFRCEGIFRNDGVTRDGKTFDIIQYGLIPTDKVEAMRKPSGEEGSRD